jgi:hypothetical protein
MTMTQEPCGDTCSVVAQMASTFKEFVPKEQRMAQAIAAVQSGKMSQRAAALKFDVSQSSLSRELKKVIQMDHPSTSQSQPDISPNRVKKLNSGEVRSALRKLCRDNNAPRGVGKTGNGITSPEARGWLNFAGIAIPPELDGDSTPFASSSTPSSIPPREQKHDTNQQGIFPDRRLSHVSDRGEQTNSEPENPAFTDELDLDAVRAHVNRQVQQSDRPADFKRAIELLTELDRICTDAWYRRHPEPWGHDDWAHVSSEIEALHSIVGQRAEETADELLRKSSDVEVTATPVH